MKTIIVGGGSAGYYLASKIKATVIEEHDEVGKPIACTGLVTDEILKFFEESELKSTILNKLHQTSIFTPNNRLDAKVNDYVLCNQKFVQLLAGKAHQNGSETLLKHHYVGNSHNKARVIDRETGKTKILRFDRLIGADGPHSKVAKNNNLASNRKHVIGMQTVRKHQMEDEIHFFPNIAEYAWAVPESKTHIRLGLCTRTNNSVALFREFAQKYPGADVSNISGTIPLHVPGQRLHRGRIAVIGDAALQTKNTTGGGIIAGLKAAEALASGRYIKNLKSLNKELQAHYIANNIFQNYSAKDWDKLVTKMNKPEIKKLIEENNRDNFYRLASKIMMKQPSVLLQVMPHIINFSSLKKS